MINSILIANRGEIASRIIKTCKRLGIRSIVVYADPDKELPFVEEADEAIALGGNQATESYLMIDKIIAAAKESQANAIHPGFGFLSENAEFAQRCESEGFIFIGPNPSAIESMGLKSTAKEIMAKHGVPIIKGYQGDEQSLDFLVEQAINIGFPILIKAVAGGGGKGMRIANNKEEIKTAIQAAQREAQNSFGNSNIILERYFSSARHIEFQIFGDKHGNVIHILERECSIQRRYQKVIEESPSPGLTIELRSKMGKAAVAAAKAINYDNAGTVEFILTDENEFYFLEVNTRLQVEHPVTEMITGLDLVEWQILVADGEKIPLKQEEIISEGYAIECRLYAEDALNNFFPATGKILYWDPLKIEGVRYESGIKSGSEISIYYDPMLAKVIAHAPNRKTAIRKMDYALRHLKCLGVTTNQQFIIEILKYKNFIEGKYNTSFIEQKFDFKKFAERQVQGNEIAAIASLLFRWNQRQSARKLIPNLTSGWRNQFYQKQEEIYLLENIKTSLQYKYNKGVFYITINESEHEAELINLNSNGITINLNGQHKKLFICNLGNDYYVHHYEFGHLKATICDRFPEIIKDKIKGGYQAPMPSEVMKIEVEVGQPIKEGQDLITLLSMKMENTIAANESGTVEEILVEEGQSIDKGTLLLRIQPIEKTNS
ncbi:MAG: biotin carboxylase [Saprospiraceae bacterium]|nr:biotin carboxylase [Saprospiraceae bacterium]